MKYGHGNVPPPLGLTSYPTLLSSACSPPARSWQSGAPGKGPRDSRVWPAFISHALRCQGAGSSFNWMCWVYRSCLDDWHVDSGGNARTPTNSLKIKVLAGTKSKMRDQVSPHRSGSPDSTRFPWLISFPHSTPRQSWWRGLAQQKQDLLTLLSWVIFS